MTYSIKANGDENEMPQLVEDIHLEERPLMKENPPFGNVMTINNKTSIFPIFIIITIWQIFKRSLFISE